MVSHGITKVRLDEWKEALNNRILDISHSVTDSVSWSVGYRFTVITLYSHVFFGCPYANRWRAWKDPTDNIYFKINTLLFLFSVWKITDEWGKQQFLLYFFHFFTSSHSSGKVPFIRAAIKCRDERTFWNLLTIIDFYLFLSVICISTTYTTRPIYNNSSLFLPLRHDSNGNKMTVPSTGSYSLHSSNCAIKKGTWPLLSL